MRITQDSEIDVATYDPESIGGLDIQRIDIPKGTAPILIHRRYVVGADAANVYQWDAEHPQDGVRVFHSPLDEQLVFNDIAGTDLAFCLLQIEAVAATAGSAVESSSSDSVSDDAPMSHSSVEPSVAKTTNKSRAISSPFSADPFSADPFSADPFGGDSASTNPFSGDPFGPNSIAKQRASRTVPHFTRPLLLFRIDAAAGPTMISRWDILADPYGGFVDVVTRVDDKLVSLSTSGDAFEYRSIKSGELIERRPLPQGFDPSSDDWAFDEGKFLAGSRLSGPLFDLATNDWLPNPGKGYVVRELWHEVDYGIYWSHAEQRSSVFDHRRNVTLLDVPESKGTPEFTDADKVAVCSTRCGFGVDVVDLRDGATLASWTPWWWVPCVLFPSILVSDWRICAWLTTASTVHDYPLLDVALVLGVIVALSTFRLKWTGTTGIDVSVFEEWGRGICCSGLILSCCGLFMGCGGLVK